MTECNSIEGNSDETHNIYPNLGLSLSATLLSAQEQFRPKKNKEIKDYFVDEVKERELMSKRLSKYIASLDYFDKSLFVLSVTTSSFLLRHLQLSLEHLPEW